MVLPRHSPKGCTPKKRNSSEGTSHRPPPPSNPTPVTDLQLMIYFASSSMAFVCWDTCRNGSLPLPCMSIICFAIGKKGYIHAGRISFEKVHRHGATSQIYGLAALLEPLPPSSNQTIETSTTSSRHVQDLVVACYATPLAHPKTPPSWVFVAGRVIRQSHPLIHGDHSTMRRDR